MRFAVRYEALGMWMFHCHILEHAEGGMMVPPPLAVAARGSFLRRRAPRCDTPLMIAHQAETQRVAQHFVRAGHLVGSREAPRLDAAQQLVRQLLLDEVARYGQARRFPKNHDSEPLRPTFIDAQGTPCAMAHLLQVSGEGELAHRISGQTNHALVRELADRPEFATWLSAAGLTVEEASIIQPSYGCTSPAECVCGEGWNHRGAAPAKAVLQALVESPTTARIEKVFGDTALRVGDVVNIDFGQTSAHVILGIAPDSVASLGLDGGQPFNSIGELGAGEKYVCADQGSRTASPPITTDVYALAVMASDCKARLIELEPKYAENPCGLVQGCGTVGETTAGSPASVGVLLAIAGVLLARRLTQR